jgi:hypothetical protein
MVCSLCLLLLFFEAAFGICLGCKIYNGFNKDKAQLCPGGACELPAANQAAVSLTQALIVLAFVALVAAVGQWVYSTSAPDNTPQATATSTPTPTSTTPVDPAELERCKVPDFAKALGHEAMWKLHNHCQ